MHISTIKASANLPVAQDAGIAHKTAMPQRFRDAFLWHLDKYGAAMAAIHRDTGVSLDILKKLKRGDSQSTNVEDAVLIADYFGKSVNAFIRCDPVGSEAELARLMDQLDARDVRMLLAQIRGIVQDRERLEALGHTLERARAPRDEAS